jgi:hypothetical protein
MTNLLEAKRVMAGGSGVVMANFVVPNSSQIVGIRIIQIRREGHDYYGKALGNGLWYPICAVEVTK